MNHFKLTIIAEEPGKPKISDYVSTTTREQLVKALRDYADCIENNLPSSTIKIEGDDE